MLYNNEYKLRVKNAGLLDEEGRPTSSARPMMPGDKQRPNLAGLLDQATGGEDYDQRKYTLLDTPGVLDTRSKPKGPNPETVPIWEDPNYAAVSSSGGQDTSDDAARIRFNRSKGYPDDKPWPGMTHEEGLERKKGRDALAKENHKWAVQAYIDQGYSKHQAEAMAKATLHLMK